MLPAKKYRLLKRFLDITVAILLILFLFPVFSVICILLCLTSEGTVIFAQKRIGSNGKPFILYKFRTMKKDTPCYMPKPDNCDARITKIGRLLRDTGFDEFPQLFNVLKGEMSLVGPRPEMPFVVKGYGDKERERLKVKPGITGLWQLSGKTRLPVHLNLSYDLFYIKNRSLCLDIRILYTTLLWFLCKCVKSPQEFY